MKFKMELVLTLFTLLHSSTSMAIEEPKYEVIKKEDDIELRLYAPRITAETEVIGAESEVSSEGFRRLANYIFGGNAISQRSEKIAMTAPVGQLNAGNDHWVISFTMPSQYTLKTLPTPLDSRVILREHPAQRFASYRYSGTWSVERYEERKKRLLEWVAHEGLRPSGEVTFARYNPPWTPWFLRRNEILIPLQSL